MSQTVRNFIVATCLLGGCGEDGASPSGGGDESGSAAEASSTTDDEPADGDGDGGVDDTGEGSGSGDGSDSGPDLDPVADACEADCEAQVAPGCSPAEYAMICEGTCNQQAGNLDGFCLEEYETLLWCKADGGYTCADGFPQQNTNCIEDAAAYNTCNFDIGCKRWCKHSIAAGCEPGPQEACVDTCNAEKDAVPAGCGAFVEPLLRCQVNVGQICIDPLEHDGPDCSGPASSVAACLHGMAEDLCQAHCYLAEALGCGDGCLAECEQSTADGNCVDALDELVDCETRAGTTRVACEDGRLVGVDHCAADSEAYDACVG